MFYFSGMTEFESKAWRDLNLYWMCHACCSWMQCCQMYGFHACSGLPRDICRFHVSNCSAISVRMCMHNNKLYYVHNNYIMCIIILCGWITVFEHSDNGYNSGLLTRVCRTTRVREVQLVPIRRHCRVITTDYNNSIIIPAMSTSMWAIAISKFAEVDSLVPNWRYIVFKMHQDNYWKVAKNVQEHIWSVF